MQNKYTGEVPLKIGDKEGILVFDWEALALARSNLSDKDFENIAQMAPDKLAILAAAGFRKHNPEMDVDFIMKSSPAIMIVANALDRALLFAYHGPETAKQILEPLDKAVDAANKKKSQQKKTS